MGTMAGDSPEEAVLDSGFAPGRHCRIRPVKTPGLARLSKDAVRGKREAVNERKLVREVKHSAEVRSGGMMTIVRNKRSSIGKACTAAFTLAETIMAIALAAIMFVSLFASFVYGYRTIKVVRED